MARPLFALVLVVLIVSPVTAPFQTFPLLEESGPIARDTDAGVVAGPVDQPRRTVLLAAQPLSDVPLTHRAPVAALVVPTHPPESTASVFTSVLRL